VEHLRRPTQISAVLDIVATAPHPGIILHWLLGTAAEIDRAAALGCYFSVNAAMPDQTLLRIPAHRMLPETDFPSRRSTTRARLPGDTTALDQRLADLGIVPRRDIRGGWYRDLRTLASRVDVIPRLACRMPFGFTAWRGPPQPDCDPCGCRGGSADPGEWSNGPSPDRAGRTRSSVDHVVGQCGPCL
jgi:hypothetical protein